MNEDARNEAICLTPFPVCCREAPVFLAPFFVSSQLLRGSMPANEFHAKLTQSVAPGEIAAVKRGDWKR